MDRNEWKSRSLELKRPGNCETKSLLRPLNYLDVEISQGDGRTWSEEESLVARSQLVMGKESL